ncbi:MAG: RNA pseudouridine synthase, partial [Kiritimatiellae bacterium]|nr:RNA pseudouridine synthase [Kiritimatiellia bacterium]
MNRGCAYRDRVGSEAAGAPLARFYAARYRHSPASVWRERAGRGEILRNGRPAGPDEPLAAGDALEWRRPPWEEPPVPRDVCVVHADADVVVVDKPSGLPTMPAGGFLENTLAAILRELCPGEAVVPVHRLGRGTSGLVLCARSARARDALARQFRD